MKVTVFLILVGALGLLFFGAYKEFEALGQMGYIPAGLFAGFVFGLVTQDLADEISSRAIAFLLTLVIGGILGWVSAILW